MAPHPPFVFGEKGERLRSDRRFDFLDGSTLTNMVSEQEYIAAYQQQLTFISTKLPSVIEEILARSSEPPVIILQADHGPGAMLDFASVQNSNLAERMSIFNAFYFPDQNYAGLSQDITPVNTFRVVFNHYFGDHREILERKNYFSLGERPYKFIDVTDQVRP